MREPVAAADCAGGDAAIMQDDSAGRSCTAMACDKIKTRGRYPVAGFVFADRNDPAKLI